MQKYAIPTLILALVSVSVYAFTSQESLEEKLEKENKQILEDFAREQSICYTSATGTSYEISQKHDACSNRQMPKLRTITGTGKLTPTKSELPSLRMLICKKVPTSPLCNKENFEMAQAISYKKALIWGVDDKEKFFRVGIGIMFAESTLGTKFAGTCDSSYNNFGGIKYRILDTGEAVRDQKIPQNGCWVYKFSTLEDYFGSKYNSLGKGYGACFKKKDAVNCISYAYVGNPNVAETSWKNNVNTFAIN